MKRDQKQGGIIIYLTLLTALMISVVDLPDAAEQYKPFLLLLVLIYWCIAMPHHVGIGIAWFSGLILDVAYNTLFGQHALSMALIIYFTLQIHQRLRVLPLWQQSVTILILCLLYAIIDLWIRGIIGQPIVIWVAMLPAITSAIIWPVVFVVLRHVRRSFHIR